MNKLIFRTVLFALLVLTPMACAQGIATPSPGPPTTEAMPPFALTSPAFAHEGSIPAEYTCDGDDSSPPFKWIDAPPATTSFALIADDPDAPMGTWVHWVIYDIPAAAKGLPPGLSAVPELPDGSRHGHNSWRKLGYGGPCPPSGTHRYFFTLYALDTVLDLEAGAGKSQLLKAMEGHILAEVQLMGTYARD
jgi:Raf kinase inhibitor-like YbhB/YbcL family protein